MRAYYVTEEACLSSEVKLTMSLKQVMSTVNLRVTFPLTYPASQPITTLFGQSQPYQTARICDLLNPVVLDCFMLIILALVQNRTMRVRGRGIFAIK